MRFTFRCIVHPSANEVHLLLKFFYLPQEAGDPDDSQPSSSAAQRTGSGERQRGRRFRASPAARPKPPHLRGTSRAFIGASLFFSCVGERSRSQNDGHHSEAPRSFFSDMGTRPGRFVVAAKPEATPARVRRPGSQRRRGNPLTARAAPPPPPQLFSSDSRALSSARPGLARGFGPGPFFSGIRI